MHQPRVDGLLEDTPAVCAPYGCRRKGSRADSNLNPTRVTTYNYSIEARLVVALLLRRDPLVRRCVQQHVAVHVHHGRVAACRMAKAKGECASGDGEPQG